MSKVSKMVATDETFREVADLLYGGGIEFSKMNPEGSDLSAAKAKKARNDETKRKIGYATNMAGAIAGPAALWQANKARKSGKGGMPRDLARTIAGPGQHTKRKGIREAAFRGAKYLDSPKSKPAKIFAAGAGASIVGLQAANWAGDTIAAQHLSASKPKKKEVSKGHLTPISKKVSDSLPNIPETASEGGKGRLTLVPKMKLKDPVAGKGKLIPKGEGKSKFVPEGPSGTRERGKKQIKKSEEFDVTWEAEISKVNADKQQVFGWASIVEIGGEKVVDLQGDYIAIDEVEKSAYEYVHKSRRGGDMHLRDGDQPVVKSHMIESFVVTPEKKEALGLPEEMPTGWWVGYQVNDPELWGLVKDGKRTGFSIHGRGVRTPA